MIALSHNAQGGMYMYIGAAALSIIFILGLIHQHGLTVPGSAFDHYTSSLEHSTSSFEHSPPEGISSEAKAKLAYEDLYEDDSSPRHPPFSGAKAPSRGKASSANSASSGKKGFYEIARKHGTDKVTEYRYQDMYARYLPYLRTQKVRLLVIGLNCDQPKGPQTIYHLWTEYFSRPEIHVIDSNATCIAEFKRLHKEVTVQEGEQSDSEFLQEFASKKSRYFDVVIDDGGHNMDQQKNSLQHLWKVVKAGGMYFCEDLHTSFSELHGGGDEAMEYGETMVQFVHELLDDLMRPFRTVDFDDVDSMFHIDCSEKICGFFKRSS
ncbi:hypothetical protein ANO11243_088100 [Dothideomycetidae sp. 11243]|nr:hypothetical protein ANO11243_088100 [fungal sp. No.11243]